MSALAERLVMRAHEVTIRPATAAELAFRTKAVKFDPSEPRDETGRWTSDDEFERTLTDASAREAEMARMARDEGERRSLARYTQAGYDSINAGLRTGTLAATYKKDVANIDRLIARSPKMAERGLTEVWRGVGPRGAARFADLRRGDTYQDLGYSSSAPDAPTAVGFVDRAGGGALLRVDVPPDLRAAQGSPSEHELILPRGLNFEYLGAVAPANGFAYYHVRVLG